MRIHRSICLILLATFLACDDHDSPTVPGAGTSRPFLGAATVLSVSGSCPGSRVGDTLSGVRWTVRRRGATSIELLKLYDELDETRFTGTIDNLRFAARFQSGPMGSGVHCYVRESLLEGELAADGGSFEAQETLEWSGSQGEGVEVVFWRVSR